MTTLSPPSLPNYPLRTKTVRINSQDKGTAAAKSCSRARKIGKWVHKTSGKLKLPNIETIIPIT